MTKPSEEQLKTAYKKVEKFHKDHLSRHKVKLGSFATAKGLWISILVHYFNQWVHKDFISKVVQGIDSDFSGDQQVRHLVRDGWNVENDGRGNHKVISLSEPHSNFIRERERRRIVLNEEDWEALKRKWDFRCATCGSKEGDRHFIYGEKTKLQKAHKSPFKELNKHNVLPQCAKCNQSYKDDYEFDDNGRVRAVASVKPVKKADESIQKEIFEFLLAQNSCGKKGP